VTERTRPSPARLRRALASGDSPISSFSVRAASLLVATLLLPGLGRALGAHFGDALRTGLQTPEKADPSTLVTTTASLVAPVLAASAAAALAIGSAQTGLAVAFRRRASVLARLFDGARVYDAARAVVLAAGVTAIAWYAAREALPGLATHAGRSSALLDDGGNLSGRIAWSSLALAFVLAATDVAVKRAVWLRKQSPTPAEAKRERRETEGDPDARRARRRAHEELARGDDPRDAAVLRE